MYSSSRDVDCEIDKFAANLLSVAKAAKGLKSTRFGPLLCEIQCPDLLERDLRANRGRQLVIVLKHSCKNVFAIPAPDPKELLRTLPFD
jgi:hypothetical protein